MSVDLRSIWKLGQGGDVAEESWPGDRGTEGQGVAWGGGAGAAVPELYLGVLLSLGKHCSTRRAWWPHPHRQVHDVLYGDME